MKFRKVVFMENQREYCGTIAVKLLRANGIWFNSLFLCESFPLMFYCKIVADDFSAIEMPNCKARKITKILAQLLTT